MAALGQHAAEAVRVLGLQIAAGRRRLRRTQADLAERAGVSRETVSRVENGDPRVAVGTVLELATLVGLPLFDQDTAAGTRQLAGQLEGRVALLGQRVREPRRPEVDDDF